LNQVIFQRDLAFTYLNHAEFGTTEIGPNHRVEPSAGRHPQRLDAPTGYVQQRLIDER